MRKKKFLLLESKNSGKPHVVGGILVFATTEQSISVSSAKLEQGYGCIYFLSKDGSSKNLVKIAAFRQKAPMQPNEVGPYIYDLDLEEIE